MPKLSDTYRRRVLDALAETEAYIAKEEKRDPSLRPADIAERLEFYRKHRTKLLGMLAE